MSTLRELREREKLSQQELSELLGVNQSVVSKYELGIRKIPPAVAERIRDFFNLTTDEMWEMLYRNAS